jgi:hypothetical protein
MSPGCMPTTHAVWFARRFLVAKQSGLEWVQCNQRRRRPDAVLLPDLAAVDDTTYAAVPAGAAFSGPVVSLGPRQCESTLHGEGHIFFQSGALQNVNVTPRLRSFGITESDERYRYLPRAMRSSAAHFHRAGLTMVPPAGCKPRNGFADLTKHKAHFPTITAPGVPLIAVTRVYEILDSRR